MKEKGVQQVKFSQAEQLRAYEIAAAFRKSATPPELEAALYCIDNQDRAGLAMLASGVGGVGVDDVYDRADSEDMSHTALFGAIRNLWVEGVADLLQIGADAAKEVEGAGNAFDALLDMVINDEVGSKEMEQAADIAQLLFTAAPGGAYFTLDLSEAGKGKIGDMVTAAQGRGYADLVRRLNECLARCAVGVQKFDKETNSIQFISQKLICQM